MKTFGWFVIAIGLLYFAINILIAFANGRIPTSAAWFFLIVIGIMGTLGVIALFNFLNDIFNGRGSN